MNLPRVELVRFRLPRGKTGYIVAQFVNGKTMTFHQGQMLAEMRRYKLARLKVAIIHQMAYQRAMQGSRGACLGVQELLAEFDAAAQEFGVDLHRLDPKEPS